MSENFNNAFPEILRAYIAGVSCELSNSRCDELSKFVSAIELRAAAAKSEVSELRSSLAQILDHVNYTAGLIDVVANRINDNKE